MASSDGLDIGNRMKEYESVCAWTLSHRIPVILRIDGRAFHTVTRKRFGKSWCMEFVDQMIETAKTVKKDIQGCEFCYSQSDEISFLITDYRKISTEAWFGYDARKMISISASLASSVFSQLYGRNVCFDSRVFSIPQDEVANYFIWRQIDATRNAIQMAGRENFSHKEMFKKSCSDIQEMLFQKSINFNKYPVVRKRGFCIVDNILDKTMSVDRDNVDLNIPIFSKDRNYVERHAYIRED
jgi:tRNA(His) guanylyltransferase